MKERKLKINLEPDILKTFRNGTFTYFSWSLLVEEGKSITHTMREKKDLTKLFHLNHAILHPLYCVPISPVKVKKVLFEEKEKSEDVSILISLSDVYYRQENTFSNGSISIPTGYIFT